MVKRQMSDENVNKAKSIHNSDQTNKLSLLFALHILITEDNDIFDVLSSKIFHFKRQKHTSHRDHELL